MVAFPFTYLLTRLRRRAQVRWLVFILAVMSLSEVIIGFAWASLLSRTAGLSNILVWLGLLETPEAWAPGFLALLLGLCYLGFPYSVLVLYPPLSRLDPELPRGLTHARAPRRCVPSSVVVPVLRNSIISAFIMVFVFNLGAYLLPQVLGRPEHWTLSVLITDQAIFHSNMPFARGHGDVPDAGQPRARRDHVAARSGAQGRPMNQYRPQPASWASCWWCCWRRSSWWPACPLNEKKQLIFPPRGFSLGWYVELLSQADWLNAVSNSLIIAVVSAALAVSIAFPLAYFLWRYRVFYARVLFGLGRRAVHAAAGHHRARAS